MSISRRVTARYNKRARAAKPNPAQLSGITPPAPEVQPEVCILPIATAPIAEARIEDSRSDLMASLPAPTYRPTSPKTPPPRPVALATFVRDARSRAEKVLREHPRREEAHGSTCQLCSFAYPCDAVRVADDLILLSKRLQLGSFRSSKELLDFMNELVENGLH